MMKIIDDKGRLFGKINIFDIMILLLVALLGVATYVGITSPHRFSRIITGKPEYRQVKVTVILPESMHWLKEYIRVGDVQRGRYGGVIAEIRKVEDRLSHNNEYLLVELKVKATVTPGERLSFGGRLLRVGEDFLFKSRDVKFKGYVMKVGE
jgi:hypothetical protein